MKSRLDSALAERGLAPSRTVAQALVLEGKVRVNGQVAVKSAMSVTEEDHLEVEAPPRFVSRGGEKLEGAFAAFPGWTVEGHVCLDVGSSTGGFTDCLLQHGAKRVMAVDVSCTLRPVPTRGILHMCAGAGYSGSCSEPFTAGPAVLIPKGPISLI